MHLDVATPHSGRRRSARLAHEAGRWPASQFQRARQAATDAVVPGHTSSNGACSTIMLCHNFLIGKGHTTRVLALTPNGHGILRQQACMLADVNQPTCSQTLIVAAVTPAVDLAVEAVV